MGSWWILIAAVGGYLVGSYGTLAMIKWSPKYRAHCGLKLAPKLNVFGWAKGKEKYGEK